MRLVMRWWAAGISIVSGIDRHMVRSRPLRDIVPIFDLLFNGAPIWVMGPGLFILLCVAAEAGHQLQQWLDHRSPAREEKGGDAGQILGMSLG